MKIGVVAAMFQDLSLEDTLKYVTSIGIEAIELGCGGYPGKPHINPEELIFDDKKVEQLCSLLKKYNVEISAISVHGNPVHPNKEIAEKFHKDFENAVLVAEKLGISRVLTFSGCPGDWDGAKYPNWVTCPWPDDFSAVLKYQWNDVLIPYWKKTSEFALAHGVDKIALEMHPGFSVYSPETLMKLRDAVGKNIGANYDPSHLFWQGINNVESIRYLGKEGAIFHFHAKDTKIDAANTAIAGVLDNKNYSDEINRSWIFRSVGYGHGMETWRDIISMLRLVGYDHVLSIEHEDSLMTGKEGLEKAVAFLKQSVMTEPKNTNVFWA